MGTDETKSVNGVWHWYGRLHSATNTLLQVSDSEEEMYDDLQKGQVVIRVEIRSVLQ